MPDSTLFPASIIGSMPRPDFVKDLIADDSPPASEDYERWMGAAIRSVVALQEAAGLDVISRMESAAPCPEATPFLWPSQRRH